MGNLFSNVDTDEYEEDQNIYEIDDFADISYLLREQKNSDTKYVEELYNCTLKEFMEERIYLKLKEQLSLSTIIGLTFNPNGAEEVYQVTLKDVNSIKIYAELFYDEFCNEDISMFFFKVSSAHCSIEKDFSYCSMFYIEECNTKLRKLFQSDKEVVCNISRCFEICNYKTEIFFKDSEFKFGEDISKLFENTEFDVVVGIMDSSDDDNDFGMVFRITKLQDIHSIINKVEMSTEDEGIKFYIMCIDKEKYSTIGINYFDL